MPAAMASRVAGSSAIVVKSERHLDTFKAGLKSFVNEARLLARFDHPALVKVYRFWEENGTAYMAMPFYRGPTLKTALAGLGHPPSEAQLRTWLTPLLDALTVMHAAQCFHRDIAPDNILLTATGPLLLDFGAARRVIGDMTHALTVVLKPGYAPIEQYGDVASMTQGAWTDIYALACVVYFAITGKTPMSSVERLMDDRLQPLAVEAKGRYGDGFLRAIDAALAVRPQDRPQNEAQFRALLDIDLPTPPPSPPLSGYGALSHEPFPATQDSSYSTVPGTLTPELATQVQARPAEPTVQLPSPAVEPPPPATPPAAASACRRSGCQLPSRSAPNRGSARRRRRAPCRRWHRPAPAAPSASSRPLVLGLASLLVVSGLAFGVYWTLQSREDDGAKPAAPAASAIALPASAAAPPVVSPAVLPATRSPPATAVPDIASARSLRHRSLRRRAPSPRRHHRQRSRRRGRPRSSPRSRQPARGASLRPLHRRRHVHGREPARVEPPAESRPPPDLPLDDLSAGLPAGEGRAVQ